MDFLGLMMDLTLLPGHYVKVSALAKFGFQVVTIVEHKWFSII